MKCNLPKCPPFTHCTRCPHIAKCAEVYPELSAFVPKSAKAPPSMLLGIIAACVSPCLDSDGDGDLFDRLEAWHARHASAWDDVEDVEAEIGRHDDDESGDAGGMVP